MGGLPSNSFRFAKALLMFVSVANVNLLWWISSFALNLRVRVFILCLESSASLCETIAVHRGW